MFGQSSGIPPKILHFKLICNDCDWIVVYIDEIMFNSCSSVTEFCNIMSRSKINIVTLDIFSSSINSWFTRINHYILELCNITNCLVSRKYESSNDLKFIMRIRTERSINDVQCSTEQFCSYVVKPPSFDWDGRL